MGKTFKRRSIKQHQELLEDGQFKSRVVPIKKQQIRDKKLTKRDIEDALTEDRDDNT